MLKKKASYLAADFRRHDRKDEAEMVALTGDSICGSAWSEQGVGDTSCSTAAVLPAIKKQLKEAKLEKQRQQHAQPSPSPPPTDEGLEEAQHSVLSIRSESPKRRRHQWSAMWFVQMSVVVVALAVAASIALVFALRDAESQSQDGGRGTEDDVGDGKTTFDLAAIQFDSPHFKSRGPRVTTGRTVNATVEQIVNRGSAFPSIKSRGTPASKIKRMHASTSAADAGVIWLNGGNFWYAPRGSPPFPPPGRADDMDGGSRRRSEAHGGNVAPLVKKGKSVSSSPSSGRGRDKTTYAAKTGRNLKRFDRKETAKNRDLHLLMNK